MVHDRRHDVVRGALGRPGEPLLLADRALPERAAQPPPVGRLPEQASVRPGGRPDPGMPVELELGQRAERRHPFGRLEDGRRLPPPAFRQPAQDLVAGLEQRPQVADREQPDLIRADAAPGDRHRDLGGAVHWAVQPRRPHGPMPGDQGGTRGQFLARVPRRSGRLVLVHAGARREAVAFGVDRAQQPRLGPAPGRPGHRRGQLGVRPLALDGHVRSRRRVPRPVRQRHRRPRPVHLLIGRQGGRLQPRRRNPEDREVRPRHHLLGVLARKRAHPLHPFGVRRPRLFPHATQYWPRRSSGLARRRRRAGYMPIAQSTPVERVGLRDRRDQQVCVTPGWESPGGSGRKPRTFRIVVPRNRPHGTARGRPRPARLPPPRPRPPESRGARPS